MAQRHMHGNVYGAPQIGDIGGDATVTFNINSTLTPVRRTKHVRAATYPSGL